MIDRVNGSSDDGSARFDDPSHGDPGGMDSDAGFDSALATRPEPTGRAGRIGHELSRLVRLAHKELREILRDRRTILTLVLMPVLLYPLLTVVMRQFLPAGAIVSERHAYRIGVADVEFGGQMIQLLSIGSPGRNRGVSDDAGGEDLEFVHAPSIDAALRSGQIDLGIRTMATGLPAPQATRDYFINLDVVFLQNNAASVAAMETLRKRVDATGRGILAARLRSLGVSQRAEPIRLSARALDKDEKPKVKSLAAMIPLILILMTITGAVYPAIDLTAGERERNTLEILVAAPTPRLALLLGKYFAVLTVAILTATVNFASMGVTLSATGMSTLLLGEQGLTATLGAQIFALMVLFAAFFSGMLLALCSFARSFKEAQAYLIPLMLASLAPGIASLMPGIELSGAKLAAPLLNIVLVGRDLMEGKVDPAAAAIAVISTTIYALAAIAVAARLFGSEGVLYGHHGGWRELFTRPQHPQRSAPISSAFLCLALIFPAYFLGSNLISSMRERPKRVEGKALDSETMDERAGGTAAMDLQGLRDRVLAAAILQGVLFGGVPIFAAYAGRLNWRTGFRLYKPAPLAWPAACLIGLSMWPFAHELVVAIFKAGWSTFGEAHLRQAEAVARALPQALSYPVIVLVFAVLPAVSEELLFRGYLFSALKARLGGVGCVTASALAFGLFHFVVTDSLAIERLLPSTLLGLALGAICWRTGSVFPGMATHVVHNGLLMSTLYFREQLSAQGIGVDAQEHLPISWLLAAGAVLTAGFWLLSRIAPNNRKSFPALPSE